jgi:hypothetical protein
MARIVVGSPKLTQPLLLYSGLGPAMLDIFIFTRNQELCVHKLMYHIMDCDHSLSQNDILKFIYYFMSIFLKIYIYKYFLLSVPFYHILILILIIFYLN